jgi:cytochrome d ubiquinol oxidase subunit I
MILYFLILVFGLHIVMVNLGIAFSTAIPFLKRGGERNGNVLYIKTAKQLMNFYAATYALAGVFGTAFTVFLLSFYPGFIGLAGHLTFVPFGIAVLAIAAHFFAISAYWYGWDRWSTSTHFAIGMLLFITVLIIPLGFRAVSAFLNTPTGLQLEPKPHLDVAAALMNPTFLPLYLKSITAALTAGFFTISSAYTLQYLKGDQEAFEIVSKFIKLAAIFLALTIILGIIYAETLREFVNYKFSNSFGILIGMAAANDVSWLFIIKLIAIAIQLYAVYAFTRDKIKPVVAAGPAALVGVFAGEILNSLSQYPYFIAKLGDKSFVSSIPEPVRAHLAERLNLELSNPLAASGELYTITVAFLIPLLFAATFFLYLLLNPSGEHE